ncbi:hypothetical protein GLYMA_07G243400v4 [Glycine max]|uniref:DUF789 family protein n=1 Tax=Glycine max TaxID=3847 RepID=A0A0R0J842_SOYBN|nr:uncharacterized protein LOC100796604 isoform X2 [Glycine max]XP_028241636.1 uncharacterized protein LOC114419998 isoform X2 [Glycine soja]KAH1088411.1 hypothetical protein GYH30_019446 [Glycine max]KRH50778.1 hypothetical protein GLYMA_07G243400v4 [Glycine max]|eukprot:XP_006584012.1 uncharacterized protein LOC100796604 isoform X2 [Glycine max]
MSASGGAAIAGGSRNRNRHLGENRFYSPPPLRKHKEKQEQQRSSLSRTSSENRPGSSSDCSISSRATSDMSNLDRLLEHITPLVPAQYFPKTNSRRWKSREAELHPYFVLGDLWESFKEWSAYGAGVPIVLNGSESVTQYYNVSLSAIQLYIDPSKPSTRLRKPSQESDSESARETSSDSSSGYCHERGAKSVHGSRNHLNVMDASNHTLERVSQGKPFMGSSSDETESCSPPGQLIFEYFEHETPYNREPLANKISDLARQFPELKTYWSCDLSPASWVSFAWYPIYRIPTGPTLQSLSACFLTFHSLSTALQSRDISKLSLPIFGLASHKFKVSLWDPDGVSECQKANSLLRAAENWLRLLRVNHPDYNYFMSHYAYVR